MAALSTKPKSQPSSQAHLDAAQARVAARGQAIQPPPSTTRGVLTGSGDQGWNAPAPTTDAPPPVGTVLQRALIAVEALGQEICSQRERLVERLSHQITEQAGDRGSPVVTLTCSAPGWTAIEQALGRAFGELEVLRAVIAMIEP